MASLLKSPEDASDLAEVQITFKDGTKQTLLVRKWSVSRSSPADFLYVDIGGILVDSAEAPRPSFKDSQFEMEILDDPKRGRKIINILARMVSTSVSFDYSVLDRIEEDEHFYMILARQLSEQFAELVKNKVKGVVNT